MLLARIVSPGSTLYFATEATPYDLENLHAQVHDLAVKTKPVRLDVTVDESEWQVLKASHWLQHLSPRPLDCRVHRRREGGVDHDDD